MNPIYLSPSRELPAKGDPGVLFGNVFIPVAKPKGAVPSEGLLAYYPFTAGGDDKSGNGQNAIVHGSPVFNAAGVSGFTGSDFVGLPTALLYGTSAFTISMKIKVAATTSCALYSAKGSASNGSRQLTLQNNGTSDSGWFVGYQFGADSPGINLTPGVEYHILHVWNGGELSCKINLEQRFSRGYSDYNGVGINEHVLGFSPIMHDSSGHGAFDGSIRDVCFYNRVLNDDEQLLLYERI